MMDYENGIIERQEKEMSSRLNTWMVLMGDNEYGIASVDENTCEECDDCVR